MKHETPVCQKMMMIVCRRDDTVHSLQRYEARKWLPHLTHDRRFSTRHQFFPFFYDMAISIISHHQKSIIFLSFFFFSLLHHHHHSSLPRENEAVVH
jgi:hypothetical protein